jgi:galactokinase/mevalonate kinase-like predicted kinase
MNKTQLREFTSWLGKRSYEARVDRLGIERIRQIARENGKKGGRPRGSIKRGK